MLQYRFKLNKNSFFDRPSVARGIDAGKRAGLSKLGAFVMRRGRSSIRSRKKASRPGSPPSSHTHDLKRGIYFGYDEARQSMVAGPVPLNRAVEDEDQPRTLEEGGSLTLREFQRYPGAPWETVKGRMVRRPGYRFRTRRIHIAARPTMGPALAIELPKLSAMLTLAN